MQDVGLLLSLTGSPLQISLLPSSTPPFSTLPPISSRGNISVTTIARGIRFQTMNTQTLDGRYVDREKLVKLLKDLFGAGNFQIKVRQGSFESSNLIYLLITYRQLTIILSFQRLGHSRK